MKVLVAGGAGYIGSVTTELLLNDGHEVVVFDNLERGHREAVDKRAGFRKGDLRDKDRIFKVMSEIRPDAVMHFAAYALVPESMEKPELYFRNNVYGGINLVESMYKYDVGKIVFSSTCATYGQPEKVPITEDVAQRPTNPYGESKLMFEQTLKWYHELHGMTTVFLRYFNACGATEKFGEDHDPETHIIPIILQVALGQRKQVKIYGDDYNTPDGTCLRDYIHIVDLAQAHILALKGKVSGPFNLGTGNGYSVLEVVETAREVTGHPIPAEIAPRRPGDPAKLVAGAEKARKILKWKPQYDDLDSILQSAWNWHQKHPRGYRK
ncbi:MAG: UDP-glucose 4-epimerase GalE [Lentisphaerae bacterium RIFOXYA12_FULL_48_11]|nr:MAG: UDP-glucose 4-epimerase GalE [Lentisphaerae bacterium RIFOXYA12_FULL_48_11]